MSSKTVPRIVPWLSASEWRETRHLLFSNQIEDIRFGILKAKIWMERGKVPTAVESTVNFLETILSDTEHLEEFLKRRGNVEDIDGEVDKSCDALESCDISPLSAGSDRVLRLAYNTCIIRFVNELVDQAQKSLFATSITKLADQIGLPRVFVDIRHDGTHDKMNSLELLRWAAWDALDWLEDQYWSFEDDLTPASWIKDFNSNVHGLLDQYCEQLEKIHEQQSAASLEKSSHARIVSQIDFLQTLPRIMKAFLLAICEYKRCKPIDNVIESILRPFIRNNWEITCPALVDVLLVHKTADSWIPFVIDELKKSLTDKLKDFLSNLFAKFAKNSSSELFKEKIVKIWLLLGDDLIEKEEFDRIKRIHCAFEAVYTKNTFNSASSALSESRKLIQKRRYVEDENLDGWTVVNENWRPCPLGTLPK